MTKFRNGGVLSETDKIVNDFFTAIGVICEDYEDRYEDHHETQRKKILEYLQTGKPLTKLEIIDKFNYINGGDAIFNLRKQGYPIETTMITNGKKRYASYKLKQNGN